MTGGGTITEVGSEPAVIDLVVNGRERLEGRIVDSDGRPLSGVHVIGRNAQWQTSAESLADGRFVLYLWELPSVLEPVSFGRALAFDPPRLSVQEAPSAPLEFVGRPSARPLMHGRVVRKGSGEPVAGVRVEIKPDCGGAVPEGLLFADVAPVTLETEPDGSFEARCAPECPFKVTAHSAATSASLDLPAGACDRDLVVELERRPSWVLEGTITDRKGVPLEGLPVSLSYYVEKEETRDAGWYPGPWTGRTGEGGRFRIEGQGEGERRYRLEVEKQGTPKALRDLVIVSKRAPGARFEVTLKPEDAKSVELRAVPGARVCARAVDAKNAPIALHSMALYAADEDIVLEDVRWQRSGQEEKGRVCLDAVVPGRYRVLLGKGPGTFPAWYPGTDDPAQAQRVDIASGMNELDPVVMRAAGGLILAFPGWSGSEPPRIEYREARKSGAARDPRPWTVFPASGVEFMPHDKRFHLFRFPVGSWEVRACPSLGCDEEGEIRSTANPVEVRQGPLAEVTLDVAQTTSLLGVPLFSLWWPPPTRFKLESDLESARKASERAPDDPEALIWLGRRTAYLGRYREAVAIFSRGVERWPEDARFLRHRGHRWITLRRFDEAIADLGRAAKLVAGRPDEVEADGQPNKAGIPTSTLHTNVWYHLGLAHFLKGEFEPAREAFAACLAAAGNDDMRVAASDWLYMALRRLGRGTEARKMLEPVRADLRLLENGAYLDRLLLYRGERTPAQLLAAGGDEVQIATHGFGVGHWHLVEGRPAEAEATFERVVEGAQWAAFGFIAAEAELARIRVRE
jgi:tetratricopeptide (TPR) repeat protein